MHACTHTHAQRHVHTRRHTHTCTHTQTHTHCSGGRNYFHTWWHLPPFSFCPKCRNSQKLYIFSSQYRHSVSQSHVMSAKTGCLHGKSPFTILIVYYLQNTHWSLRMRFLTGKYANWGEVFVAVMSSVRKHLRTNGYVDRYRKRLATYPINRTHLSISGMYFLLLPILMGRNLQKNT